jgi:hypothetical protein
MTDPDKESTAIPDDVRTALDASTDPQLREIVHDAQARLEAHPPLTEEVTIQEGEAFVREDVEIDETIREALETGEDSQLREIVGYARQRLTDRPSLTDVIEARDNEALVRMDDAGAYTTVVVERPGEAGDGRGPFAYMVQWEPHVGDDGKYKWHYLGRVLDEEEED